MAQSKMDGFDEALKNLARYLQLAPNSVNAQEVKQLINKIEYGKEKEDKERLDPNSLVGIWDVSEEEGYRFEIRNSNGRVEGGLCMFQDVRGLFRNPFFKSIQWDGRTLIIHWTRYFECDKSVQLDQKNHCPNPATLSLNMIAKDTLKGTLKVEPLTQRDYGFKIERVWKRVK